MKHGARASALVPRRAGRTMLGLASVLCLAVASASACATPTAGAREGAGSPSAPSSAATGGELLAPERVRALPAADRARWEAYVAASRTAGDVDRALLAAELVRSGSKAATRAPYVQQSFSMNEPPPAAWFSGDSAVRIAATMLTYQTPSGGWSKHVDYTRGPRAPGQNFFSESEKWQYIATIDNDATTAQIEFLIALDRARPEERWKSAVRRGIGYLLAAQMPNGCWPQVWPLQGGYHDAITFNDDAVVQVASLLERASAAELAWLGTSLRERAAGAIPLVQRCIVASQVVKRGQKTAWGQQHDPISLAPVAARTYELASYASKESAAILDWLMRRPTPDRDALRAVHGGAAWIKARALSGLKYDVTRGLERDTSAGPLWARLYTLDTERPVFANRDGVPRFDWNELTDRRQGYGWYGTWPVSMLRRYERWARTHPVPAN